MKNLLLISNISMDNDALIEYAASFCKYYEYKLHVLHLTKTNESVLVTSPNYLPILNYEFEINQKEIIAKKINAVTSNILDREFIQINIGKGNQEEALKTFISNNFIDLIIAGLDDLKKKTDFTSARDTLMNVIDVPILTIPPFQIFKAFEQFNFLTTHTENDLKDVLQLATMFPDTKISLSHFSISPGSIDNKTERWVEYLKSKVGKKLEYNIFNEDVHKFVRLENFAIQQKSDAFVFTTRKRNFWSRLFDSSTTLGFLADLEIPSVIFKMEGEV